MWGERRRLLSKCRTDPAASTVLHSNGVHYLHVPRPMTRTLMPADELMQRVAQGDKAAFAQFYDDTSTLVYSVVRRVLRDPSQSEEVTQDIYLEAWRTAARYEAATASATTWIVTMAHRRAIDRVRSSQASRDRDFKVGVRDLAHEFDHVSEEVEIRSDFARAKEALTALTALQREIVSLVYFDGYTQSELAERMQIPLSTIKTRLRDGLIRMRAEMTSTA
jgi:RNA polymerase sigma-70 factor (ECF subfamily)